ncbi:MULTISPECIES: MHYT domain-containing protein [Streptomyces]|uniref:MHYT domain-containing protein n=1 Tax=Streptomyces cheonanensis TaxID=312720 RepID=A0ABN2UUJ8_9ACTN|nr:MULTISPECIES: MHYT domain-containing protein [Streptomyces]
MTGAVDVTVDHFSYGTITPVLGYLMAVLGAALGLRCTVRALSEGHGRRKGWLVLGALALGSGIFTMHFIAMMGFTTGGVHLDYDLARAFASLAIAVVVVGVGLLLVGTARRTGPAVLGGGLFTGAGIAAMHYVGMTGLVMTAEVRYAPAYVAASVVIAMVAAVLALWCAVAVRGLKAAVGASALLGIAVSGMHYTGMAAMSVHAHSLSALDTRAPIETLMPILVVPLLLMLFTGLFVGLDPMASRVPERAGPQN